MPALLSYVVSLAENSSIPWSIQSVEWLRSNGLRGFVNEIENIYYTLTAPSKGGPALKHLPKQVGTAVGTGSGARTGAHHVKTTAKLPVAPHYEPPAIRPLITPALPGEGVWHAPFTGYHGPPPVLITSFRSDPAYPQMVAGVAWIDHTQTSVMLYPGSAEPAVSMPARGPEEIPTSLRYKLVAAFNSGFKLADSGGGFAYGGHTWAPLHNGQATIVRYTNGRMDVIAWPYGPTAPANVQYARQNLPLLVDNGRVNPDINNGADWGATLGNAVQVWRSSLGIDRHGNLIYAAADYQTAASLAQIMIHAGAVRAMELDINAFWPSFITYTGPGAVGAANLLPGMNRSPLRYLTPDERDFFAVYLH